MTDPALIPTRMGKASSVAPAARKSTPRNRSIASIARTGRGMAKGATGAPVKGPLLGGNLTVLTSLVGTGALPSFAGAVVFLEDVGERPYRLDRNLNQLRLSGIFDAVAGFVLGQWKGCDSPDGSCTGLEVVNEGLSGFGVPILAGLEVGHESVSRPLVLGAEATLDPQAGELTLGFGFPGGE